MTAAMLISWWLFGFGWITNRDPYPRSGWLDWTCVVVAAWFWPLCNPVPDNEGRTYDQWE